LVADNSVKVRTLVSGSELGQRSEASRRVVRIQDFNGSFSLIRM
jgi:hypothetical protein